MHEITIYHLNFSQVHWIALLDTSFIISRTHSKIYCRNVLPTQSVCIYARCVYVNMCWRDRIWISCYCIDVYAWMFANQQYVPIKYRQRATTENEIQAWFCIWHSLVARSIYIISTFDKLKLILKVIYKYYCVAYRHKAHIVHFKWNVSLILMMLNK